MKIIVSLFLLCALVLLTCTGDYNPFTDPANAVMVNVADSSGLRDGARVPVYTTRELVLEAAVREQIDSFSVHVDSNRYFNDTMICRPSQARYSFNVSFVDTGRCQIVVVTYRKGGGTSVLLVTVSVHSPLHQQNLDTAAGSTVTFSTPPVGDSVWYHWVWGDSLTDTVHSKYPQGLAVLSRAGQFSGALWVSTDPAGREHSMSPASFTVRVNDRSNPYIVCMNTLVRGDTVFAGEDLFSLSFDITDASGIDSATVNGAIFEYQSAPRYMTTLRGLMGYTASSPRSIQVVATDINHNREIKTFYVVYDATLPGGSGTQIEVNELRDTITTNRVLFRLEGLVRDYTRRMVDLGGTVNSLTPLDSERKVLDSSGVAYWSRLISLNDAYNTVTLTARDTTGVLLTSKVITIFQSPTAVDTTPPRILTVTVNGKKVEYENQQVFIENDSARIMVVAYDNSGVAKVSVNGDACIVPDATRPFEWQTIQGGIMHNTPSAVNVGAVDSLGWGESFRFLLRKNTVPSFPADWQWPGRLFAGSAVKVVFTVVDDDNDVTVTSTGAPVGMVLQKGTGINTWTLVWTPTVADTGSHSVGIILNDRIASPRTVNWHFEVLRDSAEIVRFASTTTGFPTVVQAGRDQFDQEVQLTAGSKGSPFRFRAWYAETGKILFDSLADTGRMRIRFTPAVADTGVHTLAIAVTDARFDCDTLLNPLTVVPANQYPCSLSVTVPAGIPLTADGAIDMSWAQSPDTITLAIVDRDNPLTEAYSITTEWSNMTTSQVAVTGRTFTLVLDTLSSRTRDTIRVIVTDRTGTRDTAIVRVNYMPFLIKKSFTVNTAISGGGAAVAGTVTNFPLVLRIPGAVLDSTAIKAGTQYLRFSRTGRETLRFEVERWAGSTDSTIVWVLMDTIFGNNAEQVVQMAVTQSAATVISGSKDVFDSAAGFKGVWHLGRLSSAPVVTPDASGSANDMVSGTGVGNSNVVKAVLGNGFRFNGTSNYLRNPSPATTLQFTTQLSVSAWVNPTSLADGTTSDYNDILGRRFGNEWEDSWLITIMQGKPCFVAGMGDTNRVYGSAATAGQWMHIAGVRNGRDIRLYVNGQLAGSGVATADAFAIDANDVSIGAQQNTTTATVFSEFFDGIIDEVRAEKAARSADWIKLNYATQKPGSTAVQMR